MLVWKKKIIFLSLFLVPGGAEVNFPLLLGIEASSSVMWVSKRNLRSLCLENTCFLHQRHSTWCSLPPRPVRTVLYTDNTGPGVVLLQYWSDICQTCQIFDPGPRIRDSVQNEHQNIGSCRRLADPYEAPPAYT